MKRDPQVAELLDLVLSRCLHDPEGKDGPAVCETCAAVVIILADRLSEPAELFH